MKFTKYFPSTTQGTWVSMGVYSDGSYNVPAGLIYSFPVTCRDGEWTIVQGMYLAWETSESCMLIFIRLNFYKIHNMPNFF